jgi:uncharacterized protein (TIGR03790 family)
MNKLKLFLSFILIVIASGLVGQTVDINKVYGLTWKDTTLLEAKYDYNAAKAKYPAWVGYMEYKGASSRVLKTREASAAHLDAVWANDDAIGVTNYANGCGSRANIDWSNCAGVFRHNMTLLQPQGIIWGAGSQGYKLDSWGPKSGGTTFIYDKANWNDPENTTKRYLIKDITWGKVDNFGYTEGAQLFNMKILGESGDFYNPNEHFSAIGAWKRGEVSNISDVFIYNCNDYGIELGGQFHATFTTTRVSIFKCNLGGYGIIGGGHLQVYMGSFDDNPSCFVSIPDANGSIGNGTKIAAYGIKFETGKTAGRPYSKGQLLFDGEGWIKLDVFGFNYSRVNSIPHLLIRIKPTVNTSYVNITGMSSFAKPYAFIHDRTAGQLYLSDVPGFDSKVNNLYWRSDGYIESSGVVLSKIPATCDGRLAPLPRDPMTGNQVGNWVGCTPAYSYTTPMANEGGGVVIPPNPTCTYVYSDFGPCVNGVKTRTVVSSSPSGCVGTPQLTEPCTVTPPPTCTYTYSVWGPCVNGVKTRTVVSSTPSGCVGTPQLTDVCTVTPPPTTTPYTALNVNKVLVLYNTNETVGKARAEKYATDWGIPLANVKGIAMGTSENTTNTTQFTTARNTITSSGMDVCVAVWDKPLYYFTNNSITSALAVGRLTAYDNLSGTLPTSPLYGYTGITPKADKNTTPVFLLHSKLKTEISLAASGKKAQGSVYFKLANDQSGQPRGRSRMTEMQALDPNVGYVLENNLNGCSGDCEGNQIKYKSDMLAYFNGMYKITGMETNKIMPGAYGDYVTSLSGSLSNTSQTPITYMLDNGFIGTSGTVVEPWQNASGGSPGWLKEQFVNVAMFSDAYFTKGLSLGQAMWSSVKCPGRLLMIADPLCTPQNIPSNVVVTPPPTGAVKWSTDFSLSGCVLKALIGNDISQGTSWACGTVVNKVLTTNSNTSYPWTQGPIKKIVYKGITFPSFGNYTRINSTTYMLSDGTIQDGNFKTIGKVTLNTKTTLELIYEPNVTPSTIIGNVLGAGATQVFSVEGIEVY